MSGGVIKKNCSEKLRRTSGGWAVCDEYSYKVLRVFRVSYAKFSHETPYSHKST